MKEGKIVALQGENRRHEEKRRVFLLLEEKRILDE